MKTKLLVILEVGKVLLLSNRWCVMRMKLKPSTCILLCKNFGNSLIPLNDRQLLSQHWHQGITGSRPGKNKVPAEIQAAAAHCRPPTGELPPGTGRHVACTFSHLQRPKKIKKTYPDQNTHVPENWGNNLNRRKAPEVRGKGFGFNVCR